MTGMVYSLLAIADYVQGKLRGDPQLPIYGIASLTRATAKDLSYYNPSQPIYFLQQTKAAAIILSLINSDYSTKNCILVSNPINALQLVGTLFHPKSSIISPSRHPSAIISPLAKVAETVSIGAGTVIEENAVIAQQVTIGSNCVVGREVQIGAATSIANQVTVEKNCLIGSNCLIDSGAIIGAMPFNHVKEKGQWSTKPAFGTVIIDDNVRVGANTVVTRGALADTYIGKGCQIDNLVQIAHDVTIGSQTAIAGCAVIGAFAEIGSDCIIGGASCVAAFVRLGDDVSITGMSTVNKSINKPGLYSSGTLVSTHHQWRKNATRFKRLDDYILRLTNLEKTVFKEQE